MIFLIEETFFQPRGRNQDVEQLSDKHEKKYRKVLETCYLIPSGSYQAPRIFLVQNADHFCFCCVLVFTEAFFLDAVPHMQLYSTE